MSIMLTLKLYNSDLLPRVNLEYLFLNSFLFLFGTFFPSQINDILVLVNSEIYLFCKIL